MTRPRYLLDTNICIYIHRRRPPRVLERFSALRAGDAAVSAITWGELRYGAERSRRPEEVFDLLAEFISLVPVLPLPPEAGDTCGTMRAALEARGKTIGNNDLWLAAHARSAGLVLVTNNEREFEGIADLALENWVGE